MLNKRNNRNSFNREKYFVNHFIRAKKVRCISDNENYGVIQIDDALKLANDAGLDLVQISNGNDGIPTCKILNYSKFKYEQSKKEKLAKKKQRENTIKVKEIKFRPSTDDNDLKTKAKRAQEFLDDGNKLKVTIVFKGRELNYKEIAQETLNKFVNFLDGYEFENAPSLSGKFLTVILFKKVEKSA